MALLPDVLTPELKFAILNCIPQRGKESQANLAFRRFGCFEVFKQRLYSIAFFVEEFIEIVEGQTLSLEPVIPNPKAKPQGRSTAFVRPGVSGWNRIHIAEWGVRCCRKTSAAALA